MTLLSSHEAGTDEAGTESALSDIAYERIRRAVLLGRLRPNQRLIEAELAQRLEMSRTPVREALRQVEFDGLAVRRGRGLFVREPSVREIEELYQVRAILESGAAAVAARDLDAELLARLDGIVARSLEADATERVELNDEFHETIVAMAHNAQLLNVYRRSTIYGFNYLVNSSYSDTEMNEAIAQHQGIVAALRAGDPARAADRAWRHVEASGRLAIDKLGARGVPADIGL